MHPLIILLILVGVVVFISWYKRAPKSSQKNALVYAGAALLILLALTKGQWLMAMVGGAVAAFQRIMTASQLFSRFKSMGGASGGNRSTVRTQYFEMSLDHDSGELSGKVVHGQHAGSMLADLSQEQLLALYAECRSQDVQSASVLESYLDRRFGAQWRDGVDTHQQQANTSIAQMSRKEALEILGLDEQATTAEIAAAHKRLIQKVHPDRGGSNYLAARINQAKDLLLNA